MIGITTTTFYKPINEMWSFMKDYHKHLDTYNKDIATCTTIDTKIDGYYSRSILISGIEIVEQVTVLENYTKPPLSGAESSLVRKGVICTLVSHPFAIGTTTYACNFDVSNNICNIDFIYDWVNKPDSEQVTDELLSELSTMQSNLFKSILG